MCVCVFQRHSAGHRVCDSKSVCSLHHSTSVAQSDGDELWKLEIRLIERITESLNLIIERIRLSVAGIPGLPPE